MMRPPFKRAVLFLLNDDVSKAIRTVLEGRKIDVLEEKSLRELRQNLKTNNPDFLFIDSRHIVKKGEGIISSFKKGTNSLRIVAVSSLNDREAVLPFLNEEISGVILEPYHPKEIIHTVTLAEKTRRTEIQKIAVREVLDYLSNPHKVFIGKSGNAIQVRKSVQNSKKENGPVLIIGEAGTGKTQISYSIHLKQKEELTPVRVYDPVIEPERGRGFIKYIEGLGHSDALIIKNTQNLNSSEVQKLVSMVEESKSKDSSLPRFILHHDPSPEIPNVFKDLTLLKTITVDPLRERKEDITPLINYFQNIFTRFMNVPKMVITPQAGKLLRDYRWPFNVTELIGVIVYTIVTTGGGEAYPFDLPDFITSNDPFAMEKLSLENLFTSKLTPIIKRIGRHKVEGLYSIVLSRMEVPLIKLVLEETGGNQVRAARILGINRNTLMKKIKEHKILVK